MKNLLKNLITIIILLLSISFQTFAQKQELQKTTSKAETFSERSGSLIKKEYIRIGSVKSCEISVVLYTDLITTQKTSAVKFSYEKRTSYGYDTKVALLDFDEIDALCKSIKLINDTILKCTPTVYTEVSFFSRDGFSAGCFSRDTTWSAYMKLEKHDSDSYIFIDSIELLLVWSYLNDAKTKMQ